MLPFKCTWHEGLTTQPIELAYLAGETENIGQGFNTHDINKIYNTRFPVTDKKDR